jgi:type II secretory pathway pseudopilin PulG
MTAHNLQRGARLGWRNQAGFSLLETVFALGLLLIVAAGVLPLGLLATKATENEGHLMARTTEYAQDKLEQLLALAYGDAVTNTCVFPAANSGGTGLAVGGSANPAAPVANYADYLDERGNLLAAGGGAEPAGWFYKRVWQVELPAANLKRVTVTATVRTAAIGSGRIPQSTVAALKTFPF